jgi:hypothetical protein
MKKLYRIVIGIIFAACSAALFLFGFSLVGPVINWGSLIPVVLAAMGSLFIAWQIITGATWRDIMDFITDVWR